MDELHADECFINYIYESNVKWVQFALNILFLIKTALLIDMTFFTLLSCDYHEYSHAFVLFCRLGQMQISGLKKIQAFVQNGYLWTF